MIDKYRMKDSEVKDLQLTLKQVQAEKVRFQKEMAKKAREAELQRRRKELEESKRRQKDRKEQEALERQIKQLEIKLSREKGWTDGESSCIEKVDRKKTAEPGKVEKREVKGIQSESLIKQVNGIVRREVSEQVLKMEYVKVPLTDDQ